MNKFDEMMAFLAARDPEFCQVVAVDSDFGVFTRAWCMAEVAQARTELKWAMMNSYSTSSIEYYDTELS